MTLLIATGDRTQIHLSSDFRLSENGYAKSTVNGGKQLSILCGHWTAQLGFTGIATDGRGYDTQMWLVEYFSRTPSTSYIASIVEGITAEATLRMGTVTQRDTRLTLVLAAAETGLCHLFVISNWERLNESPADVSGSFNWWEVDLREPQVCVFGQAADVSARARERLKRLVREGEHPKVIRGTLASINRAAARSRRGRATISPQCWVHSLLDDGQSAGVNEGMAPGHPATVQLGVGEMLTAQQAAVMPHRPILRQFASYRGPSTPAPPPLGDPVPFAICCPAASIQIARVSVEAPHAILTIEDAAGVLSIQKNTEVIALIGIVRLELYDSISTIRPFKKRGVSLAHPVTVDGVHLAQWAYAVDAEWTGKEYIVTIPLMSRAIRRENAPAVSTLGSKEELTFAAPFRTIEMVCNGQQTESELNARFGFRDWIEVRVGRRPI